MASNENAMIMFESGVTSFPMAEITDSGDHKTYNTLASILSMDGANEPKVLANGIVNGGVITPDVATNKVAISTLLVNLNGVATSINANTLTITRPATNVARVVSITVTAAGAFAAVNGTDGATTVFSATRGAAGGPPYIPIDSVEIGQVKVTTSAAALIQASEIFAVDNLNREMADFPIYKVSSETGKIVFNTTLSLIHTGDVPKKVYASYAEPVFLEQPFANDFTPADQSITVNSTQVYGDTIGTSTKSLTSSSFTAILKDAITDAIISKEGKTLWFKFFQDRFKTPYILTLGSVSLGRTFNASAQPTVTVTIAASQKSINKAG